MNASVPAGVPSAATIDRLNRTLRIKGKRVTGFWVQVRPNPRARRSFCDENVAHQIRDHGGEAFFVWDVTENGPLVELEAHVIWRNQDGNFLDVSPSLVGAPRHFVFPSETPFQRPFPGNVIVSLSKDPTIKETAHYLSLAHVVLAPRRANGALGVSAVNVKMWAHDFIRERNLSEDAATLEAYCLAVIRIWNRGTASERK